MLPCCLLPGSLAAAAGRAAEIAPYTPSTMMCCAPWLFIPWLRPILVNFPRGLVGEPRGAKWTGESGRRKGEGRHDSKLSVGLGQNQLPILIFPHIPWLHAMQTCRHSLCKTVEIPSPHPKKSSTQLNSTRCLQVINDGKEVSVEWDAPTGKEPAKIATGLDGSFMLVMRSHSFQDASVYRFVACLVARDGPRSSLLLTFLILLLLLLLPRFAASFTFYSAPSHDREAPNCSMYTHICAHL